MRAGGRLSIARQIVNAMAVIADWLNLVEQQIGRFFSESIVDVDIANTLSSKIVKAHPWVVKVVGAAIAFMTIACRVAGCVWSATSAEADVMSRVY